MKFSKNTPFYDLDLWLDKGILSLSLKSYEEGCLFSKIFNESDIGQKINRKMDLLQIFECFSLSRIQDQSEEVIGKKMTVREEISDEKICELVMNKNKIKCYKIEKNGCIHVFLTVTNNLSFQTNVYESILQLQESRKLTQSQIYHKSVINKKDGEVKRLKQQLTELNKKLDEQKHHISQLIKKQLDLTCFMKTLELKQINQQRFHFDNHYKLTYDHEQDQQWRHFYFCQVIQNKKKIKFHIKILQINEEPMYVGIGDYEKNKNQGETQLQIGYKIYSSHGHLMPDDKNQGQGFKKGDTVTVFVNQIKGTIQWSVNGQKRVSKRFLKLKQNEGVFMPFVALRGMGNAVQWCGIEEDLDIYEQNRKTDEEKQMEKKLNE